MASLSELRSQYLYDEFDAGIYNSEDARPSKERDTYWIKERAPKECRSRGETYGKWLVFKHVSVIDKNWDIVSKAVASGELGATGCKVSTRKKSPNSADDDMHVICVYTTKEDMDEVGMKLIPFVKQTIRYKTDEATLTNKYTCHGDGKVTCRTLEWNSGRPRFKD